nr:probable disease resistance protein At4g19520 [Malus domestica]
MIELSELNLSAYKIKELPSSIINITDLHRLDLEDCKELESLPSIRFQLESLRNVNLSGCTKVELHLDGTSIEELSPSIERLQGLELCLEAIDRSLCRVRRLSIAYVIMSPGRDVKILNPFVHHLFCCRKPPKSEEKSKKKSKKAKVEPEEEEEKHKEDPNAVSKYPISAVEGQIEGEWDRVLVSYSGHDI